MCNDYANHVPWSEYVEAFSDIKLPVVLPKAALISSRETTFGRPTPRRSFGVPRAA